MVVQYSDEVLQALNQAKLVEKRHAESVGRLAIQWAHLDVAVDALFEPLLECSSEQVACIRVENIASRCEMLKKLVIVEGVDKEWRKWIEKLLNRISKEIAQQRNRFIHDLWEIKGGRPVRTDKRARLKATEERVVINDLIHDEDIDAVSDRIYTVFIALCVARKHLNLWRSCGSIAKLDAQWLPAAANNARFEKFEINLIAFDKPQHPLKFRFD